MSGALYWRPSPPGVAISFDSELKFVLRGYFSQGINDWVTLDKSDVKFLRGVIAGAGENSGLGLDARGLLAQIELYGSVQVQERP